MNLAIVRDIGPDNTKRAKGNVQEWFNGGNIFT